MTGESKVGAELSAMGRAARAAVRIVAHADSTAKNNALIAMACAIDSSRAAILAANAVDMEAAAKSGVTAALADRLRLDEMRVKSISDALRSVAGLPDPVGAVMREWTRPNGLRISKVRVPLGVVGIIFESRPNVTCDAAALCFKSGNAVMLRGGSDAIHSNLALCHALGDGLEAVGMPRAAVQLVSSTDRAGVEVMCGMAGVIDVIIPRGGKGLIETVVRTARMPVIKHFDGVCAVYVDSGADINKAVAIIVDAKCRRPGVCNAAETLLVHRQIAPEFFSSAGPALLAEGVELRCDGPSHRLLERMAASGPGKAVPAVPMDFRTEFLDLKLAVKIVDSVDEAIAHIEEHGSHHSDAIVTRDEATARKFLSMVDSATVYWNASTRFTDGEAFGFGAEIGISTDKVHARGPMGLEELTSYKYILVGDGQVRG